MNGLLPSAEPRRLRDDQLHTIEILRGSLAAGHRRPMVMAPTGWGKTLLASHIVQMAREKGRRVVFCVPAIDLIDQTLASFWHDGVGDIGVIQADHIETDWSRPVQIASVQTLMRRGYPPTDLVIIDEGHRRFDFYERWMADPDWASVPFIGLSATPWTKGLAKIFDDLIISATTAELIEAGLLSKFRVFAPDHPDLRGVKTVAGDYHEGQLSEAMNKAPLVANVVETWVARGEDRPTLCFAVDRAHAKHLQQQFEAAGVPAGYQDAHTPKDERKEIRRKFHRGEIKVVCNVGTLTTGVDWDVRAIILARPTRSEILFVQIIGRGLRTAEGKADCLILDHSDTTLRLGFVTDIHHEELDDGRPRAKQDKKREALPKECPKCTFLRPARVSVCPSCGFKPEPKSKVETAEGRLIELGRRGGLAKTSSSVIELRGRHIPLGEFYGELKSYARLHCYKPGWAFHQYLRAVGKKPATHDSAGEMPISPEVEGWIKSRQIAWAKGGGRVHPA